MMNTRKGFWIYHGKIISQKKTSIQNEIDVEVQIGKSQLLKNSHERMKHEKQFKNYKEKEKQAKVR